MNEVVVTSALDFEIPMHRHDDARVILVTSGEISEMDILGARRYCAGEFIFRPPYYLHGNGACDLDAEYVRLRISQSALKSFTKTSGWRSGRGCVQLTKWSVARLCSDQFGGDMLLRSTKACEPSGYSGRRQGAALHALANDLRSGSGAGLQLTWRAKKMGVEPYQLTRQFVREFGLTPSAFGREARLYRALQLLMNDGTPLSQVAAICGYADQSHFTRDVAGATNRTPSQIVREFRSV